MQAAEHARIPVPPPLVFLAFLVGALGLHSVVPLAVPWPLIARIVGGVAVVGGLLLASLAVRTMLRAHTSPDPGQPTANLVTGGPYALSRNPIYLGFSLIYVGFTLLAGTVWGLILAPLLLIVITRLIVRAEENYLLARFNAQYGQYLSRVRRWI